jgi:hypothetical protein
MRITRDGDCNQKCKFSQQFPKKIKNRENIVGRASKGIVEILALVNDYNQSMF